MSYTRYKRYMAIIALFLFMIACQETEKKKNSPGAYDLSNPEKFFMPNSLLEISGITFRNNTNDTVYAIQDEEGKVFYLAWQHKKQQHVKFAKHGDYEDIAIINNKVLVLKSNGVLLSFPLAAIYEAETNDTREITNLLPNGEYEAMYADNDNSLLYILCKNCEKDDGEKSVSGYILHAGDSIYQKGEFQVSVPEIRSLSKKMKKDFRPSGLAQNPVTKEWFIISAVNKLLVVADGQWKIKEVWPLNGNMFNQPEGIAFDANGNLYISNEGDEFSEGNILKFARR